MQCKQINELLFVLTELDSVTKRFKNDTNTVGDVRAIVEELINRYPEAEYRLASSADIIVHPVYKQAVAKNSGWKRVDIN